jgi:hypothetical protein
MDMTSPFVRTPEYREFSKGLANKLLSQSGPVVD